MNALEHSLSSTQSQQPARDLRSIASSAKPTFAIKFEQSIAVVIGINDYTHIRQLKTPVSDAQCIGNLLRDKHGYQQVFSVVDGATRERLVKLFTEELPAYVHAQDRLLIYFAGHGIALNGEDGPQGYLIPSDARPDDHSSFLSMADLYDWLNALPCRHLLLVLDCCFAGAFTWYGRRQFKIVPDVLYHEQYERFIREPAWQILTSAAYDEEALDVLSGRTIGVRGEIGEGTDLHSPFALALLLALDETGRGDLIPKGKGDGIITATELYLFLRYQVEDEVGAVTSRHQTPELWPFSREKHGKGEYIFQVPGYGELKLEPAPTLVADNNPYRGLEPYQEGHAELFFGRTELVQVLANKVENQPLTVVLGASGTGKSSLVKAGLVPYWRTQETNKDCWCILPVMRPTDSPIRELNRELTALLDMSISLLSNPAAEEVSKTEDKSGIEASQLGELAQLFEEQIDAWLKTHQDQHLLLIIDQFEELITRCKHAEERVCFLDMLSHLLHNHPNQFRIIVTLRTDFEPQLAGPPLSTDWHRFVVPPMSQAELRAVIEGPAAKRALFFDPPALVDALINEVVQMPGALPLLSFTLSELYLKYLSRQTVAQKAGVIIERSLSENDYVALGGVIGSLRTRADELCKQLDAEHQATLKRVMLRMISFAGSELTSRHVPLQELQYRSEQENKRVTDILQRLIDARLVVSGSSEPEEGISEAYVEPAHDALVRAWGQLSTWLHQEEADLPLQILRRLTQAAMDWAKAQGEKRKQGLLWDKDPRLPQIQHILETEAAAQVKVNSWLPVGFAKFLAWLWPSSTLYMGSNRLNAIETEFIKASVVHRAQNAKRRHLTFTAVLIILAALTMIALWQRNNAVAQRDSAWINESKRLAIDALQQLTVDPVSSIKLSIDALPVQEPRRPVVPEAEFSLAQALRVNQERAYLTTTVTTREQVAIGFNAIAIGGENLRFVDFQFQSIATLRNEEITGVSWSANGLLLAYGGSRLSVWQGHQAIAERDFGAGTLVYNAEWRPLHKQIAVIVKGQDQTMLGFWIPTNDSASARQLITTAVDLGEGVDVHGLRWSPDGQRLAIWGAAHLLLWDSVTQQLTALPGAAQNHVQFVQWSANSADLLGAWDGLETAYLWPVRTLSTPITLTAGTLIENGVFWQNEQEQRTEVLIWGEDGKTHRFTLDGTAIGEIMGPGVHGQACGLAFNQQHNRLLTYLDSGAGYLWSPTEPIAIALGGQHAGSILQAAWHGGYVATVSTDGAARVWDGATGNLITTLPGHKGRVLGLAWLGERYLLTYDQADMLHGQAGSLRLWEVLDAAQQPVCQQITSTAPPECIFYSQPFPQSAPDNPIIDMHWFDDETIWSRDAISVWRRWRLNEPSQLQQTQFITESWTADLINPPLWSPKGDRILTYGDFGARMWTLSPAGVAMAQILTASIENAVWLNNDLLFAEPSGRLLWMGAEGGYRQLNERHGFSLARPLPGRRFVMVDQHDNLRIWSPLATSASPVFSLDRATLLAGSALVDQQRAVTELQTSADGKYLLIVLDNQCVIVWNLEKNAQRAIWRYPTSTSAAETPALFHPTQPFVVTAQDNVLYLLKIQDGGILTPTWQSVGIPLTLNNLTWSKAGLQLVTWGGTDALVWQWNPQASSLTRILRLPQQGVMIAPQFDDQATNLATMNTFWGVRLWTIWSNWQQITAIARQSCTRCN